MKVEGLGKVFVYRICTAIIWIVGIVALFATFFTENLAVISAVAIAVIGLCVFLSLVFKLKEYKVLIGNDERRTVELTKTLVFQQALWSIVVNIFNLIPLFVLLFVIFAGMITVMGEALGIMAGVLIAFILLSLYMVPITVSNINRVVFTGEYKLMCGPKSIKNVYRSLDNKVLYTYFGLTLLTSIASFLSSGGTTITNPTSQGFGVLSGIIAILAVIIGVYTSCLLLVKSGDCFNE